MYIYIYTQIIIFYHSIVHYYIITYHITFLVVQALRAAAAVPREESQRSAPRRRPGGPARAHAGAHREPLPARPGRAGGGRGRERCRGASESRRTHGRGWKLELTRPRKKLPVSHPWPCTQSGSTRRMHDVRSCVILKVGGRACPQQACRNVARHGRMHTVSIALHAHSMCLCMRVAMFADTGGTSPFPRVVVGANIWNRNT